MRIAFEVLLVLSPRGALPDQATNRVFSSDVVRNLVAQSGRSSFVASTRTARS